MNGPLTQEEVECFHRDGFLVPNYRLQADDVARLRRLSEALVKSNAHLGQVPLACPHVPGSGLQKLRAEAGWLDYPTIPGIVERVAQLIGEDIILWGSTLFHKPAFTGRRVPWHRDGRYWPIEPLATTSVWIAVTDCTVDNGCLRCVAGSHGARTTGRHYRSEREDDLIPETLREEDYDAEAARDIELRAGQMVIFDVYTAHGSKPNRTASARIGFAMRYMPSTSYYNHHQMPIEDSPGAGHHLRPLLLVRGVDRCGRNDFHTGHPSIHAEALP